MKKQKLPIHINNEFTVSRLRHIQWVVQTWPDTIKNRQVFEFGCKRGETVWALAQHAHTVWCWDFKTNFRSSVERLNLPNVHWIRPHWAPHIDTVYCAGVLPYLPYQSKLWSDWLDDHVTNFDANCWIFKEARSYDGVVDGPMNSNWTRTEEVIRSSKTLRIDAIRDIKLKELTHDQTSTHLRPLRFFLCSKI